VPVEPVADHVIAAAVGLIGINHRLSESARFTPWIMLLRLQHFAIAALALRVYVGY